ncbi:MAG TPA: prolyl aminopeptidase [Gammaproteobacteria bacterium]|nr:prolyl aminopeptidase [Gammaproteobacteria bacterium]
MSRHEQYPPIEPYDKGYIAVGDGHELYYEQSGNPGGKPALFVHGGPGIGGDLNARRFFDPEGYRIVVFDQRGAGRSRPYASLEANTTWHLVADIERLRAHLAIDRWLVFGGSWGSTLALAYAETHPNPVSELVLRGIFLLRQVEIAWFYQFGASMLFPEQWQRYLDVIPLEERGDLLGAYHRRLLSDDKAVQRTAARAWAVWEGATSSLKPNPAREEHFGSDEVALALARIEAHYFVNRGFFTNENQLLDGVDKIRHIPAVIVQGRYDVVCPIGTAWELHRRWPEADFRVVVDAGHSAYEPGITAELVGATQRFVKKA